ncbi:hypothetical protein [Methylobacterium aquaticum]|uniref:Uncharacterized protein n=1 Tax=Methylobacterium aquaticum TaxID=270351 RepID=A0A0C6FG96_9HYPH|nr:hypothetical protein [Methylobacterium aquaticum]BAQ46062.1 hypothetical protein Maq22A_c14390 [Methylobacterium aquaticum]
MQQRVKQLARASPTLARLQAFILGEALETALLAAVSEGRPPVGAISGHLIDQFGLDTFKSPQTKQFVGVAVAAKLETLGYVATGKRIRITNDPIFTTGGLFREVAASPKSSSHELLARFVAALTEDEALIVTELLERRRDLAELSRNPDD